MGGHYQWPWQVAKEFAANNVCVQGAASTVQKGLREALSAVLVRQPMDDDAGVLAVDMPSSELHRHRDVAAARNRTQLDKLVLPPPHAAPQLLQKSRQHPLDVSR